jgi:hypothetical protein
MELEKGHGGAHAFEIGLAPDLFPDSAVACCHPVGRVESRRCGGVDGEAGRDFSGDVASHAIGHDQSGALTVSVTGREQ